MNGQSTLVKGFASLPGQATAVYTSAGLDHYRHSDWLGSARLTSSPTQSTGFLSSLAYAPFGETYASSGTTDPSFTGQNPDTVSTDYDFLYRPYSTQGRWPIPDPAGLAAVDPSNPQSWNRYAYVLNNPFAYKDPTGLDCIWVNSINDEIAQFETGDGDCTDNGNLIGFYVEGDGTVVQSSVVVDANGDVSGYLTNGDPFCSGPPCDVFTTVNVSASPLPPPGSASSGIDWAWWKGLAASPLQWGLPTSGTGSWFEVFENTVKGPVKALKSVRDNAKDLLPTAGSAASGLTNVSIQLSDMLRKRQLDPFVGPAVVAGARIVAAGSNSLVAGVARAAPYVPQAVLIAGDAVLLTGVAREGYAALTGKCHP